MRIKSMVTVCLAWAMLPCAFAAESYKVAADGKEVTDTRTGLIWRRCAEGMTASARGCTGTPLALDHTAAVARAAAQAKAGGVAWRLPTTAELRSIADESRFKLAIDTEAFPGTPPEHFWTAHRLPLNIDYAYAVNFYNGFHYDRYHTNAHHVRLVRSSP
jgi:Protein of unknown function (DUF1566)